MKPVQLLYRSLASHLGQAEILDILRKSQAKNQRQKISGILLYRHGEFLQFIEGPASAVNELFETISKDPRHHDLVLIDKRDAESLVMPTWAMGYFSPELDPTEIKDAFLLREPGARSICELLPEHVGQHFIELLDREGAPQ